jgi:hypothetical protein
MKLLPGRRLVVAPHFHASADWSRRLLLGAGLERAAEGLSPRGPWRPAGADELALLVLDPGRPTARGELPGCLCLFVVPGHLRASFWRLVAGALEMGEVPAGGFDAFVAELARFLAFKQLAAPAGAVFDLVVSPPGRPPALADPAPWGLVNLGEEAAWVAFVNVPAVEVPGPDYPPVRLLLAPGEGVRFPPGLAAGPDSGGQEDPDVLLLVRPQGHGSIGLVGR